MKTIKLNVFLIAILVILIGCHSKNNYILVSKEDSTKVIDKNLDSSKKSQIENCNCKEFPELKDLISCEETVFSNGAKIYRQFNCDSSWLVFENQNLKKNIYSLDKELIDLTYKLGYVGWDEYKESILITDRLWSGSSSPFQYHLIDKETGKEIFNLGQAIYFNQEQSDPYFVSLDMVNSKIRIYNLDTRKTALYDFNTSKLISSRKLGYFLNSPEELFDLGEIKNNIFKISYSYRLKENDENFNDEDYIEEIVIDLNKVQFN